MTLPDWLRLGRDPTDAEWAAWQQQQFENSIRQELWYGPSAEPTDYEEEPR